MLYKHSTIAIVQKTPAFAKWLCDYFDDLSL